MDTDFIVGTAIRYFKAQGFDCYWLHVSDDPSQEGELCGKYKPALQDGTDIKQTFRLSKPGNGLWGSGDTEQAEQELHKKFEGCFGQRP